MNGLCLIIDHLVEHCVTCIHLLEEQVFRVVLFTQYFNLLAIIVSLAMLPVNAFADETTENDTWIAISYPGDVAVKVLNGEFCENDTQSCQIIATQEGKVTIEIRSRQEDSKLASIVVKSGAYSTSLDDVQYNHTEAGFQADKDGVVTATLNLRKNNAYLLNSALNGEGEETVIYISYEDLDISDIEGVPMENDPDWGKNHGTPSRNDSV